MIVTVTAWLVMGGALAGLVAVGRRLLGGGR